jgi:hypothetical protein
MKRINQIIVLAEMIILPLASPAVVATDYVGRTSSVTITLQDIDSGLTSSTGDYRWLDVANQLYSEGYQTSYDYTQANVGVTYELTGEVLSGTLTATNLKPNFAYQLKLVGYSDTVDNERIGLAGRWWQEEWNGTQWTNGQNLNNKGDGSSPNPNDITYFSRRDTPDATSPSGLHYRYTGYLVFDYFITDENGNLVLPFETDSSYHVLWATNDSDGNDGTGHRDRTSSDGPLVESTFDADLSTAYPDTGEDDYTPKTVGVFGEWERLPVGGIYLQVGDYLAQMILTEESFHGSGGTLSGSWAGAMGADIQFSIVSPTAVTISNFQATPEPGHILVNWDTALEVSLIGFNLYRSTSITGEQQRLNSGLILITSPGEATGASYIHIDADVQPAVTYYYWLELLEADGSSHLHGPTSATARHTIYIPTVSSQ